MIVTPSILTQTAEDVAAQITRLLPYFSYFQIDIADGKFVENTTVQIAELVEYFKKTPPICSSPIAVDFHLMVEDYESAIQELSALDSFFAIKTILIHFGVARELKPIKEKFLDRTIGLVLNPEDSVQDCLTSNPLSSLSHIQIMSVSPGGQGRPFIPETLQKIEQLRISNYRNKILLDGGINSATLSDIISREFIPDIIGPGSYLSQAENLANRVNEMKELLGNIYEPTVTA